ncbi:MAG: type ISP restriction/modification enzyme [Pararhizobium sp.]
MIWHAPTSPRRGEVPSACEAMRGLCANSKPAAPSSGPLGHLLAAGEKREQRGGRCAKGRAQGPTRITAASTARRYFREIPGDAWTYRLSNRSGPEWILDQHKEKTPKDPTIREKFNT